MGWCREGGGREKREAEAEEWREPQGGERGGKIKKICGNTDIGKAARF